MKRLLGIVVPLLVLAACGSNNGGNNKTASDSTPAPSEHQLGVDSASAGAEHTTHPGYAIMLQQDCKTCHTPDKQSTGPSFMMIAARYDSTKAGTVEHLAKKVISGGSGSFGTVPMTPHPSLSQADAETLVKYVLSYK